MQKRQQAIAQSDMLIVPGQRIGPIRLGMGMDEVVAKLGQPDFTETSEWRYWSLNLVVGFYTSPAPAVAGLSTQIWADVPLSTVFRTAEGIGIGSSSFDVKRAYGKPHVTAFSGATGNMFYDSPQIRFFTLDYKVDMIDVP
jgi:hypothetical protein